MNLLRIMSKVVEEHEQSEWEKASFISKWSFSVANPMINKGMKGPHQSIDDLMLLSQADRSGPLVEELVRQYNTPRTFFYFLPKLVYSFISAHWGDWILVHILAASEGCTRIASPVVINYLLLSLAEAGPIGRASSFKYAGILGILNLIQTGEDRIFPGLSICYDINDFSLRDYHGLHCIMYGSRLQRLNQ